LLPDQFKVGQRKNPSGLLDARPLLAERQAFDCGDLGAQGALVHFQHVSQFRERQIGPPRERRQNNLRQHRPLKIPWVDDWHDPNTPIAPKGASEKSQLLRPRILSLDGLVAVDRLRQPHLSQGVL
jgi:hypothetical protein